MEKRWEEEDEKTRVLHSEGVVQLKQPQSSLSNPKRLLFDRRYGWVVDEWQEPSKEALAAGRGMFCVVPLAKGLIEMASNSIDAVAKSTMTLLENQDHLSPLHLQAIIGNQFLQLRDCVQTSKFNFEVFNGKPIFPFIRSLQQHKDRSNLH